MLTELLYKPGALLSVWFARVRFEDGTIRIAPPADVAKAPKAIAAADENHRARTRCDEGWRPIPTLPAACHHGKEREVGADE